jgi:hypothetical protein
MKSILLTVPDPLKAQLDALRAEGYSLNGYINAVLARAVAETTIRTGRVTLTYRKPGGAWRRRTVPARQLEATILRLENAGAEIITRRTAKGGSHGTTR